MTFDMINRITPIEDVRKMYDAYHEMDIRHFEDALNERRARFFRPPLRMRRMAAKLSQAQLAVISGVPVRSIQQYEQRRKDLNKAAAETGGRPGPRRPVLLGGGSAGIASSSDSPEHTVP